MDPTTEDLLMQYAGKLVPYTFNAGFVCLSFAISLIGTGTTLELMRRRTSRWGLHNLMLLVGASVTMGGIAIWSMHFIGNRAIYMLDGQEAFQIAYSTGLTVGSLLVPIVVLNLAFLAVSAYGRIRWWRVVLAGCLSGGAICGMHYMANASISNYNSTYKLAYVIGSVIIALAASTTALAVFFIFESTWNSAWWKRLSCAIVLAGAVSGMHWCAAVGTSYRLKAYDDRGRGVSRQDAMIVVICLSIAAGVAMTGMAIYSSWVKRDYASKSQQVVLAAGIFDEKGRIMVSQDGFLPTEVVTDTYLPKSNDDLFDTANPLFHWMFRASRSWATITKVITEMAGHIGRLSPTGRAGVQLVGDDGELVQDYDIILRELFCVAAMSLASKTKETLARAGSLWDEIFVTGELTKRASRADKYRLQSMAEKGFATERLQEYGRGCLMFLVRQVDNKRDIEKLQAAGYIFAEVHQVVGSIRSSMHIKTPDLEARLMNMARQRDKTPLMAPGVHLGVFAVRARIDRSGFDVLARREAKNLLPTVPVCADRLDTGQTELLDRMRGMSMTTVRSILCSYQNPAPSEKGFITALRDALESLDGMLADDIFDEAVLLPKELQLPCSTADGSYGISTCTLIAFRLVAPIHAALDLSRCAFTPLDFFKIRQLTYQGSANQTEFSHMIHREITSAIATNGSHAPMQRVSTNQEEGYFSRSKIMHGRFRSKKHGSDLHISKSQEQLASPGHSPYSSGDRDSLGSIRKMSSSNESTFKEMDVDYAAKPSGLHAFGGIMVSQEISVDVQESRKEEVSSEVVEVKQRDGEGPPNHNYVATAIGEMTTNKGGQQDAAFVDELLALTMQRGRNGSG